ncbi:hypothetical protein F4777DRAFT_570677 [Nemania sp. FL0916]|nr:hypothetical protein F4777DRAFT_570677 [Nemania sp. FL0916]
MQVLNLPGMKYPTMVAFAAALGGVSAAPVLFGTELNKRFVGGCNTTFTGSDTLNAICYESTKEVITSLNLNHCVSNRDGQLIGYQEGNFSSTCRDTKVDNNGWLTGTCDNSEHNPRPASVNLDLYVKIDLDHGLSCFDIGPDAFGILGS